MAITAKKRGKIVQKLAAGETVAKIAKDLKISRHTVTRHRDKPEVKAKIERVALAIADEGIETAALLYLDTMDTSLDLGLTDDEDNVVSGKLSLRKEAHKAADKVLEISGVTTGHTPSMVTQFFFQGETNLLMPNVQKVLDAHLDEIIDVESED